MDLDAPAIDWVRDNLGPAATGGPPPPRGEPPIRTAYYETQEREAESIDPFARGLPLQLTFVGDRQLFVSLDGIELGTDDVTVSAPGDFLKIDLHTQSVTAMNAGLRRSGALIFGESGAGFSGLIYVGGSTGTRILRVNGTAAKLPDRNLDDLLTMHDGGDSRDAGPGSVAGEVNARFTARLKAAPPVQPVFFPGTRSTVRVPDEAWVEGMAIALVCTAVGELAIRNFRQLVDIRAASDYLDQQFESPAAASCARMLYDDAYDEYAVSANGVRFSEYLHEREHWCAALAAWVTGPTFLATIAARVAVGDAVGVNGTLSRALFLLKRLGASTDELDAARATFASLPSFTERPPGTTLNRLDFPNSAFAGEIIAVASEQQSDISPWSRDGSYTMRYAPRLMAFLDSSARRFRTAVRADDSEMKGPCSALFCFAPGTPILLADGCEVPIEAVPPAAGVRAADGSVTVHADEDIVFPGVPHEAVYGINEVAPFFTAGHMFLTRQGYRAIDADAPTRENPDVQVAPLRVGDRVLRLASAEPFRVEEVSVERLPFEMLTAGSRVHGLKLDGAQSYFAHGFAVAANYPRLTEERIVAGIRSLSDRERRVLLDTLRPVLPLLVESMRDFAGPQLVAALDEALEERA